MKYHVYPAAATLAATTVATTADIVASAAPGVGREVVESSPDEFEYGESGYLNKFLRELVKASSQCDVEALQFLLSR